MAGRVSWQWLGRWWPGLGFVLAAGLFVWLFRAPTPKPIEKEPPVCQPAPLNEQIQAADLIVVGQVFAVVPSSQGADVLITPQRVYQGELPPTGIRIVAQPGVRAISSESGQKELHFASDQPPYLLFLKNRPDGRYETGACAGSRILGDGLTPAEGQQLGSGELVES